jgi:FAD/FMN-containing dehydrogenase
MSLKDALVKISGIDNISDSADDLRLYSQDLSLSPPGMADIIAWPENTQEVSQIVTYCNTQNIPVVPVSSREHVHGAAIPTQGGVIIDLKRMDRILEIDLPNRLTRFEAGVTWNQLTAALSEKGMRVIMPLLPRPYRSVLTDMLEREVPTNVVYDYGEPTQSLEIVWADGSVFRSGSASVNGFPDSRSRGANPSGPGLDFYRFLQGAQGTLGIVTWMSLKIESVPRIDRVLLAPVSDLAYAQRFLYRILPRRIGQECLLLNNIDLAGITAEGPDEYLRLCDQLPPWTLVLVISGLLRRPEEKIAYERNFLDQVVKHEFQGMKLSDTLPGFPGLDKKLLSLLRTPWPVDTKYWKNRLRGACQDIFFITKPEKTPDFICLMDQIAAKNGYPIDEIGRYIQPIEHNRACQMEFSFFYHPDDPEETALIRRINREAPPALIKAGAFFSRPYGDVAPLVFGRAANYTAALKRVKKIFDPNNILNPGHVCF